MAAIHKGYTAVIVMNALLGLIVGIAFPSGIAPAQDLDRLVSATVKAAPAPRALEELSKQIGVPLVGTPTVGKDILAIRVEKVSVKDLMGKIAATIHAGWEPVEGGYRLVRTEAIRRKEMAEEQTYEAQLYAKAIEEKRKVLASQGELDQKRADYLAMRLKFLDERSKSAGGLGEDWRLANEISEQSPASRAMMRICALLTPMDLAGLPSGKRIVFSNQPTRMQRPMPNGIAQIVADFKKEQTLMSDTTTRVLGEQTSLSVGDDSIFGKVKGTPTKVLLSVYKDAVRGGVYLRLQVANERGYVMGSKDSSLSRSVRPTDEFTAAKKVGDKETPLKLSPTSQTLSRSIQQSRRDAPAAFEHLSTEARTQVLKPQMFDPLSFYPTELVFGAAEAKKLNVVATFSDMALVHFAQSIRDLRPSIVLYMLEAPETGGKVDGTWLTLSPPLQSLIRTQRMDRFALAKCLDGCFKKNKVGLEELAEFAETNENEQSGGIISGLLAGLGVPTGRYQGWNWLALKFYGSLTPVQFKLTENGQTLPLGRLSPNQLALVHRMVFDEQWANFNFSITFEAGTPPEPEILQGHSNIYRREPTECMPNGIRPDGLLRLYISRSIVAFAGDGSPDWAKGRPFSPDELAWETFVRENRELFPWVQNNQQPFKLDRLRMGDRFNVAINFQFTKEMGLSHGLTENAYGSGPEVSIQQMPAEYRTGFDKAYAQLKDQYKNAKPGDFDPGRRGNGNIPPRR